MSMRLSALRSPFARGGGAIERFAGQYGPGRSY